MLKLIESFLIPFRKCFSRLSTFKWFAVSVTALMLRADHLGATSIIRDLGLNLECYESLIHFFHSRAYKLPALRNEWYRQVAGKAPLYKVDGRAVLVGDGVKQCKEAFHMPGVKKMVQESETCSKPEYIHGHLFGAVGVIIGNAQKKFCLPLKINLQDGLGTAASWPEAAGIVDISSGSHIEQMIEAGFEAASQIGRSFFLLDRYFLSRTALVLARRLNRDHLSCENGGNLLEIITKAKTNCIAYRRPYNKKGSKGRPRKRGSSIKVGSLFNQRRFFKDAVVEMYGKKETVSYYSLKLLWGQGLYQELRFVLVEFNGMRSILVSMDTALEPQTIIELYAVRFGIESLFREFKQQMGGFAYHFWTGSLPKLNHFARKEDADPLAHVEDSKSRTKILEAIHAIESFVLCSSIAMGILQILSLDGRHSKKFTEARYLRTYSKEKPSEGTVMYYLRKYVFLILSRNPHSFVTQYIQEKQLWQSCGNKAS